MKTGAPVLPFSFSDLDARQSGVAKADTAFPVASVGQPTEPCLADERSMHLSKPGPHPAVDTGRGRDACRRRMEERPRGLSGFFAVHPTHRLGVPGLRRDGAQGLRFPSQLMNW